MPLKCALFAFIIGTHEPIPIATVYPVACDDGDAYNLNPLNDGIYWIKRPVADDFDVEAYRKSGGKLP